MGFSEYLAARDFLSIIGQPIITYILVVSLLQGIFSILCFLKKEKYYNYLNKCLYISTSLYLIGFIFLVWFHIQIYNTVSIDYPEFLQQIIPAEKSRLFIPLWIESEKLYFWGMITSILILTMGRRRDIISLLGIVLSIFSTIIYLFSNPFKEPLPVVHSEIARWYATLASGDGSIFQVAGTFYGRITFYYNSTYMWTHPPMLFIAYATLVITAAACVYMLFKQDKIYDEIAYRYAKIGYLLLTIGMLIGYPWAVEAWKDSAWWLDPKISGSIMMWVLYTAYLHAHIYVGREKMRRVTAGLGLVCFTSLIFTYLLTYIVPGIHSVVQP